MEHTRRLLTDPNYRFDKDLIKFLLSCICYIGKEALEYDKNVEKEYYKDIFIHYGSQYPTGTAKNEEKLLFPFFVYETGEFCNTFIFFKDILEEYAQILGGYVVRELGNNLTYNKKYQRRFPVNSAKSVLAILHVVKIMLFKFPSFDAAEKKKLIMIMFPFTAWANPVGAETLK